MEMSGRDALPLANAVAALDRVWKHAATGGWKGVPRVEMVDVAQFLCVEARRRDLRPEQLVLLVKESWKTGGGRSHIESRRSAQILLDDMISLCITEFFKDGAAAAEQGITSTDVGSKNSKSSPKR